jgi:Family of unknown function (DUF5989)
MLSIFRDLWIYMRRQRKFWLMPLVFLMVVLGGLVVLSKGSAVAPFVYALF